MKKVKCKDIATGFIKYSEEHKQINQSGYPRLMQYYHRLAYTNDSCNPIKIRLMFICLICGQVLSQRKSVINHIRLGHTRMQSLLQHYMERLNVTYLRKFNLRDFGETNGVFADTSRMQVPIKR